MDADEVYQELSAMIRRAAETNERNEKMLAEFRDVITTLLSILQAKGQLGEGHLRLIEKLKDRAKLASEPKIELNAHVDKYVLENAEVDCGSRMHLCHGRCCSFKVRLSRQDLAEGGLEWEIDEPYYLKHNAEGYCTYQARETGFCGTYQNRPAPCRVYDCKDDKRIWLDFDAMIPAPMADGLITIRRNVKAASGG
jgi:hypothetical protein